MLKIFPLIWNATWETTSWLPRWFLHIFGGSKSSVVVIAAGNILGGLSAGGIYNNLTMPHRPPRRQIELCSLSCLGVDFKCGKILQIHDADRVSCARWCNPLHQAVFTENANVLSTSVPCLLWNCMPMECCLPLTNVCGRSCQIGWTIKSEK